MLPGFARRSRAAPALAHDGVLEIEGAMIRLRVNARARRVSLRLDARRGEMVATAPSARRLPEAVAFAQSRIAWVRDALAATPPRRCLAPGGLITLEGAPLRLERAAMRISPKIVPATADEPQRLLASGDGEVFARAAARALKARALARLEARTLHYAERLGQPAPQVRIGDPKSRWGSCRGAHGGRPAMIRYSWRLILAPPEVLDYVAAHECAHLVEPNHAPAFWTLVAEIGGDPSPGRAWLRRHGRALHAIAP